jgi:anti-sigma factor RsiW
MKHVEHLILDWLDGRLDEDGRGRVREHCLSCADCRRALAEGEAVWSLLGATAAPAPRPVWADVDRRLRRREPTWLRWSYPPAAAAVLALGILAGGHLADGHGLAAWLAGHEIVADTALAEDAAWSLDALVSEALAWNEEES